MYRLKDSDVTWLYGPLHTAVDPVPPPKQSTVADRLLLDAEPSKKPLNPKEDRPTSALATSRPAKPPGKPILKHRSLSEILGVNSTSPVFDDMALEGSDDNADLSDLENSGSSATATRRVAIASGGSDSTLTSGSPKLRHVARVASPTLGLDARALDDSSDATSGEESDSRPSARSSSFGAAGGRPRTMSSGDEGGSQSGSTSRKAKKHISFSHRVEQCIAVDSEDEPNARPDSRPHGGSVVDDDDDDDDDEEDDVLMFRSSSRHGSTSSAHNPYQAGSSRHARSPSASTGPLGPGATGGPNWAAYADPAPRETMTIAWMAPTTLKSSEELPAPSPVVVYHTDPEGRGSFQTHQVIAGGREPDNHGGPSYYSRTYGATPSQQQQAQQQQAQGERSPSQQVPPQDAGASYNSGRAGGDASPHPDDGPRSQWDDDTDDYAPVGGFDYFSGSGPDLGVGDEYDMPSLPSQHLASGAGGGPTSPYATRPGNASLRSPRGSKEASPTSSGATSPRLPRSREGSNDGVDVGGSKIVPKSILKHSTVPSAQPQTTSSTIRIAEPIEPVTIGQTKSSSGSATSPQVPSSASFEAAWSREPGPGSPATDRPDRRSRGRSSSRGSSASSIDRSTGADRRTSPSQSPPSTLAAQIGTATANARAGGGSGRNSRQSSTGSLNKTGSAGSLQGWKGGGGGGGGEEEDDRDADEGDATSTRSGKGLQAMNESEVADSRAMEPVEAFMPRRAGSSSSISSLNGDGGSRTKKAVLKPDGTELPPSDSSDTSTSASTNTDGGTASSAVSSPIDIRGSFIPSMAATARRFLARANPQPAEDSDNEHLFDSPSMPSSPTASELGRGGGSFSSLNSLRWSDETPEAFARRSLIRAHGRGSGTFREAGRQQGQGEERVSIDSRRMSGDDFGFGYGYDDDDGVVSRASEIIATTKDLMGALWTVGSRSIWRRGGPPPPSAPGTTVTNTQPSGHSAW